MSKKENKKGKKGGHDRGTDYEDPHKAVIIGETFTNVLEPLTSDIPNLLLPLSGIPIIEFILNSLSSSNIFKEIIICIKNHGDILEKYLNRYHRNLNYRLIKNPDFKNVGDCLRKLYAEKLISNDFVLIRGLVIVNSDYDELYNIHLKNKSKDKNCLVTTIMKKFKNTTEIKTDYDENILIYDNNNKKIYQYEPTFQESKKIKLYDSINNKKENVDNNYIIRGDLVEAGIEICSNEFLNLINENFELKSIRDSIKHILVNEIYVDTFYLHELGKDTYCGLIRNIESYLKVNFEVLNRWAYPLVIDNIDMSNKLKINLKQIAFSIYSDKDTNFENYHKANLVSEVVILNKENKVGKESRLQKCILCNDVKVGKKCYLYNCIICKGAEIEDNVTIKNSIIGEKCIIKKGLKIISSVLGKNIIQDKDSLQERIFYENSEEGDKKEKQVLTVIERDLFLKNLEDYDLLFISNNSNLYDFNDENLLDDLKNENEENMVISKSKKELNKIKCNYDEDEFLEDESISSESSESSEKEEEENYSDDITNILSSGIDNKSNIDDLIKEVGSLKSTYWNHTYEETIKICLSVIITKFLNGQKFSRQHIDKIGNLFKSWKNIFTRFVPNKEVELHLISVIEQLCIEIDEIKSAFHILIQVLNSDKCNVIGDESIIEWNKNEESFFDEIGGRIFIPKEINEENKKKMEKYIKTNLENDESEDDEEEEEEEDDDDNNNKKNE